MLGEQKGTVNIQAYLNKNVCYFKEYLTELKKEIITMIWSYQLELIIFMHVESLHYVRIFLQIAAKVISQGSAATYSRRDKKYWWFLL